MTSIPLRCHLLIGPPGSGKTTMAQRLQPLLHGNGGQPAIVLSTDAIRAELYGDEAVQGPWDEIRAILIERLHASVAAGNPVIIDATHARRPWRLLYTQQLELAQPVEWIGWWLKTDLNTCLEWTKQRKRPVPDAIITEYYAALNHKQFGPQRAESFATVVSLDPVAGETSSTSLAQKLTNLDASIRNSINRDQAKLPYLHQYSRLKDLERLFFLLRLLTTFNGLNQEDPATAAGLAAICNPLPEGDLAEQASVYLSKWIEVHGGNSECYGDPALIRADLEWLTANGFTQLNWNSDNPIYLGEYCKATNESLNGGFPSLADKRVFIRVFTLLRHILKEPFDAPSSDNSTNNGLLLYQHLLESLSHIDGSYTANQEAVLRNDLRHLLRPYGFSSSSKGRPDSLRHGYAIGTALLSADQLLQVHELLKSTIECLNDSSQHLLYESLDDRLRRAGLLQSASKKFSVSNRAIANRSITENKLGTLADSDQSQKIEKLIFQRKLALFSHIPDNALSTPTGSFDTRFRAWPLQLLFHNISWYLAFEIESIGRPHGLIKTLRVDRLILHPSNTQIRRNSDAEHLHAIARLSLLLGVCGGLYFGNSIEAQLAITAEQKPGTIAGIEHYELIRFSCTEKVFKLIREESNRFLITHTSYSKPITAKSSWEQGPSDCLEPNSSSDSHPYPVELLLPRWTVEADWDLRSWLFRWGSGIRIEQPQDLKQLHLQHAQGVIDIYK